MKKEEVLWFIACLYFGWEGTWPFANAHHGDGSLTTMFDYLFHIGGVLGMIYFVMMWLFVEDRDEH